MNFKQWLIENEHQDDEYESLIADSVYTILDRAIKAFFQNDKQIRLSQLIKQIAKGHAHDNNGRLEIIIPKNIRGTEIPDHFFNQGSNQSLKVLVTPVQDDFDQIGASYGYGHLTINIHTPTLAQAHDYHDQNVQKMLMKIQYQLHHEATHISSGKVNNTSGNNVYINRQAAQGSPEYNKAKVDYYTDPGELRAHAKQFAIMYHRFYPGEAFDVNKMLALDDYTGGKVKRYFHGLNSPDHNTWNMDPAPYQQQLQQAGQQFMQLVNHFHQKRMK